MSAPGPSKKDQASAKKCKRKTEAQKLDLFGWDKQRERYPPNNELLHGPNNVPNPYNPKSGDSDISSGEEAMKIDDQPQSPINQIPAFPGGISLAAPADAAANGDAFVSSDPDTAGSSEDLPIDMDSEHRLAKLAREQRIRDERLKKKALGQDKKGKSKSPPSTAATKAGGVAKKKKQVIIKEQANGNGSGPSKVAAAPAVMIIPAPAAVITPAPAAVAIAAADPSPEKEAGPNAIAPANRQRNPITVRKKITKPAVSAPAPTAPAAPSRRSPSVAEPPVAAAVAAPTPQVEAIPLSASPNTPGALVKTVMAHVNPLVSRLPRGALASYLTFFLKLTREQQEQHADVISCLAQASSAELVDFVQQQVQ